MRIIVAVVGLLLVVLTIVDGLQTTLGKGGGGDAPTGPVAVAVAR